MRQSLAALGRAALPVAALAALLAGVQARRGPAKEALVPPVETEVTCPHGDPQWRPSPAGHRVAGPGYMVEVGPGGEARFRPAHAQEGGLTVSTSAIASLGQGPASVRAIASEGCQVRIDRGWVEERVAGTGTGVEQSWAFRARPRGAITVELEVSGGTFQREDGSGLLFALGGSGFPVRYGRASWTDANGRSTALSSHFEDGRIRIRVPETLVAGSRFPAVLDPLISAEVALDEPRYEEVGAWNNDVRLTASPDGFLAVWSGNAGTEEVYAARVGPDGRVLDANGVVLASGMTAHSGIQPAAAFDGTNYLVLWREQRTPMSIVGSRVRPADGEALDVPSIHVADGSMTYPFRIDLGFDGTNYVAVWSSEHTGVSNVYKARIAPDGTVLDPGGIAVDPSPSAQSEPAISCGAQQCLISWRDDRDQGEVAAMRFDASGASLDPTRVVLSSNSFGPIGSAFDGNNHLVAWASRGGGVGGVRVPPAGAPLDPPSTLFFASVAAGWAPSVAWDGAEYLIACVQDRNVTPKTLVAFRMRPDLTVLDPAGLALPLPDYIPANGTAVAFAASTFLLAFSEGPTLDERVRAVRVSPDGTSPDPARFPLHVRALPEDVPSISAAGDAFLVGFQMNQYISLGASLAKLGDAGPEPSPIDLAVGDGGPFAAGRLPAVATDGERYLFASTLVLGYSNQISGLFIDPASSVPPAGWFPINGSNVGTYLHYVEEAKASAGGGQFLVAWQESDYNVAPLLRRVAAVRVAPDGGALDPVPLYLSADGVNAYSPGVAYDGTGFLVAWSSAEDGGSDLRAQRVLPDGSLAPFNLGLASSPGDRNEPALARGPGNLLLVWIDRRSGFGNVFASRLDPASGVVDPTGVPLAPGDWEQAEPDVGFDGDTYWVVWRDERGPGPSAIYGARFTADGTLLDPGGVLLAGGPSARRQPTVSGKGGRALLAFTGDDDRPEVRASRVYLLEMGESDLPPGTPCGRAGDCASGMCVDGVCCTAPCAGQCEACNLPGSAGQCMPVLGAPTGARPACAGTGGACGGTCDGITRTACRFPDVQVACSECRAGTATVGGHCDGAGHCESVALTGCAPYVCGVDACLSSCASALDCAANAFCDPLGSCRPRLPDGSACTSNGECFSGSCASGVCGGVPGPTASSSASGSTGGPAGTGSGGTSSGSASAGSATAGGSGASGAASSGATSGTGGGGTTGTRPSGGPGCGCRSNSGGPGLVALLVLVVRGAVPPSRRRTGRR